MEEESLRVYLCERERKNKPPKIQHVEKNAFFIDLKRTFRASKQTQQTFTSSSYTIHTFSGLWATVWVMWICVVKLDSEIRETSLSKAVSGLTRWMTWLMGSIKGSLSHLAELNGDEQTHPAQQSLIRMLHRVPSAHQTRVHGFNILCHGLSFRIIEEEVIDSHPRHLMPVDLFSRYGFVRSARGVIAE